MIHEYFDFNNKAVVALNHNMAELHRKRAANVLLKNNYDDGVFNTLPNNSVKNLLSFAPNPSNGFVGSSGDIMLTKQGMNGSGQPDAYKNIVEQTPKAEGNAIGNMGISDLGGAERGNTGNAGITDWGVLMPNKPSSTPTQTPAPKIGGVSFTDAVREGIREILLGGAMGKEYPGFLAKKEMLPYEEAAAARERAANTAEWKNKTDYEQILAEQNRPKRLEDYRKEADIQRETRIKELEEQERLREKLESAKPKTPEQQFAQAKLDDLNYRITPTDKEIEAEIAKNYFGGVALDPASRQKVISNLTNQKRSAYFNELKLTDRDKLALNSAYKTINNIAATQEQITNANATIQRILGDEQSGAGSGVVGDEQQGAGGESALRQQLSQEKDSQGNPAYTAEEIEYSINEMKRLKKL
jgi:hypothetical protein